MKLEPVMLTKEASNETILSYFMGKNTQERQEFIINNLRNEDNLKPEDFEEELKVDKAS